MSFFSRYGISFTILSLINAFLGWIFWLIAANISEVQDIGIASSVINIATLFSSTAMLGIEIPLLKNSLKDKKYFGTTFLFESLLHASLTPLLIISILHINENGFFLALIGIIILIESLVISVSRFSLLGILSIKSVIITDILGSTARIVSLVLFLNWHMGLNGILFATISQSLIMIVILMILAFRKFGFQFEKRLLKVVIKEGLSNFPNKISSVLQNYGTISTMVFLSISNEAIAGVTIAMSLFKAGTLITTSLTTINLPSSTKEKTDLSHVSLRTSMIATAPIITLMIMAPDLVLSLYNVNYVKFAKLVSIFAISIIPFVLSTNLKITLNHKGLLKKVTVLGIIESITIVPVMLILTPIMGGEGIAWSILAAFLVSGILSFMWSDFATKKSFVLFIISVATGVIVGLLTHQTAITEYIRTVVSVLSTIVCLFLFKLVRLSEISLLLKHIKKA